MSGERTIDDKRSAVGDMTGVRTLYRYGRFVTVAVPSALVALTVVWLNLGATVWRDAVLWCSLVLLAVSMVILGVAAVRGGGQSRKGTYGRAVRVASVTPGCGEGPVPSRLRGTLWQSIRSVSLIVAIPTLLALWCGLAIADSRGTGKSAVLADAGAVIESLPITKIENEELHGRGRTAGATADYTVLLPSPNGGKSVPVTFEATTNRRQGIGSELDVAYVPDRPDLGAIGDDRRDDVERQLDGRYVEISNADFLTSTWALLTLVFLVVWWRTASMRRRARTVDADWNALRVTVTGAGQHVDKPPLTGTTDADKRKQRDSTRTLQGLVLESDGLRIPFNSQMASEPAGNALSGAEGWLLWHPRQRRSRDSLAELVGDDGWRLPGAIPVRVTEKITKSGTPVPPHPDPTRRVRTLDPGAGWLMTTPKAVAAGWAAALGCLTVLTLVPGAGTWRFWTAGVGFVAPFVGFLVWGMAVEGARVAQAETH